jgi:hypothetical protein
MSQPSDQDDEETQILVGSVLFLFTLFILVAACLLIWFATLRENQVFWTYAGGYPILLRDLVHFTFFPLFIGTTVSLLAIHMACFAKICASLKFFILESFLLLVCWLLLATAGTIAFRNNLHNLLNGSPLHRHEKPQSPG